MKNYLLILLFLPLGLFAQDKKASFGVKTGAAFSSTNDESELMPGFTVGGFANYKISKVFSLQGELLYSSYSYDTPVLLTNQSGGNITKDYNHFNFSKIELPLLIKAETKTGTIKPFASFGISPGINLSGNVKPVNFSEMRLTNLNSFSLSVIPSVGFSIKDHFIFDTRYAVGVTDQYSNLSTKVNIFYVTLGYKF